MVPTRIELIFRGPYPSVWAMLALYQHPDNKKTPPKLVSSYQQLYEPTKVDQSSRWTLEWPALGIISDLKTDMNTAGHADSTCLIQCEKADISIQSQSFTPYLSNTYIRPPIQTRELYRHPPFRRFGNQEGDLQLPTRSRRWMALSSRSRWATN